MVGVVVCGGVWWWLGCEQKGELVDYQDGYVDQFILAHAVRLDIGRTGLPEAEAVQGAGDGDGVVPGGGVRVGDGGGDLGPRSR